MAHCDGYAWDLKSLLGKGSYGNVYKGWNSNVRMRDGFKLNEYSLCLKLWAEYILWGLVVVQCITPGLLSVSVVFSISILLQVSLFVEDS